MFTCAGINVLEGYGLTETSPVISVNDLSENGLKFGTVGKVLKGVEVKIAEDGEILCKGPNVMKGYFKEPEMTKESIDPDGWFHTGDLGRIEPEGHLKITGRKKELFKTSFGKYISPQPIEDKFKESLFIDQMIVLGEHQKFAGALIVPDFAFLKSYCGVKEIQYITNGEVIQLPRIRKRFKVEVDKYNATLGETEKIKTWDLVDAEWTAESGELTPTLKLRRNHISKKYETLITRLFE
jgi:long-chain acyl-CoA synthetase